MRSIQKKTALIIQSARENINLFCRPGKRKAAPRPKNGGADAAGYLARPRGVEPPAYRLGVDPIRHREVASNA